MNEKEIRISNLLLDKDGNIFEVGGVLEGSLLKKGEFIGMPVEWIKPIPLTEEWLLNMAFRTEEPSCFELDNIQINTNRQLMWIHTKCKSNIEIGMPDYVYQLQNLYFALTGEELLILK